MTAITKEGLTKIIETADEVLSALAGTNDDVHPDNSKKMCDLWDDLNDRHAPPEVVKEMARLLLASMDGAQEPVLSIIFKDGWPEPNSATPVVSAPHFADGVHEFYAAPQPLTDSDRAELQQYRKSESADREMLNRLALILSGSDAPGEIRSLTVTAQSFVDRCKTLARERDALRGIYESSAC